MKGVESVVNPVMIFLLILVVMITLIIIYNNTQSTSSQSFSEASAKNYGCQRLTTAQCEPSTDSIEIPNFDANKNGEVDDTGPLGDTLLELCRNYFDAADDLSCKQNVCGCTPQ